VKISSRLGVRPTPVGLNGPVIVKVWMWGRPAQSKLSAELRRNGCSRHVSFTDKFSMNVALTVWTRGHVDADAHAQLHGVTGIGRLVVHRRKIVHPAES
jgi:hypothetical protein